jgi:hypothetical protein
MGLLNRLKGKLKEKGRRQPTLKRLLRKQTRAASSKIFIRDKHIDPITDAEFDEFLKVDNCHKLKWEAEGFDCDDISLLFLVKAKEWFWKHKKKNASIGWIWSELPEGKHAFIFYVRKPDYKCIFFKPQKHKRFLLYSRPSFMLI